MKAKSIVSAVVLMLVSVFTYANNPTDSKLEVVSQQSKNILKVIYQGASEGKAVLKVYNQAGEVVFSDNIFSEKGFIRPLNFAGMESGLYKIEVRTSQGVTEKTVSYELPTTGEVTISGNEGSVNAVHVSKLKEENKYLVSIANKGVSDVTVKVYDGNKELVYKKKVSINGNYGAVYTIKNVLGTPSFQIVDANGNTTTK
ncbi:MAG: hypothetical protein ACOVMQ_00075 [Cyclobacteriaceae bacterium]|jgi:hypothetical protein